MRSFITIKTIFFFCLFNTSFNLAQTTLEEYNYMTKGHKYQLEHGLDMKKGYFFNYIGEWSLQYTENLSYFQRQIKFQELIHKSERRSCGILMTYKRSDSNVIHYFCIPSNLSSVEVWNLAFNQLKMFLKKEALTTISYALMQLMVSDSSLFCQATAEEYRYVVKGYKETVGRGLDLKEGYNLTNLGCWGVSYTFPRSFQRNVEFKGLLRKSEQKFSSVMAIYKRTDTQYAQYFCIPHSNNKLLWDSVLLELGKLNNNQDALFSLTYALMRCVSSLQMAKPKTVKPYLGISVSPQLCVVKILNDGLNCFSGLQVGDRILSLNGMMVSNTSRFIKSVQALSIGSVARLVVEREGRRFCYYVKVKAL